MNDMIADTRNSQFPNGSAPFRLQISMGNKKCGGKYLAACIEWALGFNPNLLILQVSDTLHRHNIAWKDDVSQQEAWSRAKGYGDAWIDENWDIVKKYERHCKIEIERWSTLLNLPEYYNSLRTIEKIYTQDREFRNIVDNEIQTYFQNTDRKLNEIRFRQSKNYILEELAVSESTARQFLCNEIYPGDRFAPEQYLCRKKLNVLSLAREIYIHLEFKHDTVSASRSSETHKFDVPEAFESA